MNAELNFCQMLIVDDEPAMRQALEASSRAAGGRLIPRSAWTTPSASSGTGNIPWC